MAGEVIRKTFVFLNGSTGPGDLAGVFAEPIDRCCFRLEAFASISDSRDLVNDFWTFHKGYEDDVSSVNMLLTKPFDSGFGSKLLDDDTHGVFFPLGHFVDENGKKYIRYELDWRKVLTLYGADVYQIITAETAAFGSNGQTDDYAFCLQNYTPEKANKTIRFTITNHGAITDRRDITKVDSIYYPRGYKNQLRVKGWIGKNKASYVQEYTVLNNQFLEQYESKRTPKYSFGVDPVPEFVHELIEIDILQADTITVTGYHNNNPWFHVETPIARPKDYEPTETVLGRDVGVVVEVEHGTNTGRKRFCLPN